MSILTAVTVLLTLMTSHRMMTTANNSCQTYLKKKTEQATEKSTPRQRSSNLPRGEGAWSSSSTRRWFF